MVQSKCPVCSQEYTEGADESCSRCCYLLTTYSPSLLEHPEVQEREKKRLQSAKEAWKKWYHAYSDLKQQLEAARRENQSSLNNSLVEQYLQDIPNIRTILQQIYETLAYQALGKTVLTEIKDYENSNSNINDNDEVLNLVKNYNQQANFPDKIEVSQTEDSYTKRRYGSQDAAVFKSKPRGEYWIIDNKYLIPKPKHKIQEHNYETLATLFECYNYEPNGINNITLIKPAQVSLIDGEEKWQLEEIGILQF